MTKVVARPFVPELDSGFIYATMPKAIYFKHSTPIDQEKRDWFQAFHEYMKWLLINSEIEIACLDEEPDFVIGYAILCNNKIEFVYVKKDYRKKKIATLLLKNKTFNQINENNLTKIGESIWNKRKTHSQSLN